jgi:N-acetylglucosamine-6-phosphate deacetylase
MGMNHLEVHELETINRLVVKSVDFHCHGVGRFDFTEIHELNLQEIENILAERNQRTILTLYLPKSNFQSFLHLMDLFHAGKESGRFKHIVGFGLEGPVLASHGGTPEKGLWMPTKQEWKALAECGKKGLLYIVLSPDAELPGGDSPDSITWISETLLDGGVLPAPGHFTKNNPAESAKLLQSLFDVVAAWGKSPTITDHLFNDMPHNFKHAWRTTSEKMRKEEELKALDLDSWNLSNLEEKLGVVPAVIIKNAHKGIVKICQNFDGEHVDLAIVKKTVELVGAKNMLMMTDSIESRCLAGHKLTMQEGSTLLYQAQGIVAAGSQSVFHQIKNMLSIGLSLEEIDLINHLVPIELLRKHSELCMALNYAKADCI